MKIKLDIDATPQELRSFFGLPDMEPLQQQWLEHMREKMLEGMDSMDPSKLLLNSGEQFKAFEAIQKAFWQSFTTPKSEPKD